MSSGNVSLVGTAPADNHWFSFLHSLGVEMRANKGRWTPPKKPRDFQGGYNTIFESDWMTLKLAKRLVTWLNQFILWAEYKRQKK